VTRAKICGITRAEDAELAADLGAWALGLILWPPSPRACEPAVAAGIVRQLRRRAEFVGVFVDPTLDEVADAVEHIGLTAVQIHGDQGPTFCAEVRRRTGVKVIKAVHVRTAEAIADADRYRAVDFHLLDAAAPGSGETWDWALVERHRTRVPVILSGGLTPENLAEGIEKVHPYAVDVASGVESSPGIKDPEKLEAFLSIVRPPEPELAPEPEPDEAQLEHEPPGSDPVEAAP
jgi:phosphoribosylanthranilate isomerase